MARKKGFGRQGGYGMSINPLGNRWLKFQAPPRVLDQEMKIKSFQPLPGRRSRYVTQKLNEFRDLGDKDDPRDKYFEPYYTERLAKDKIASLENAYNEGFVNRFHAFLQGKMDPVPARTNDGRVRKPFTLTPLWGDRSTSLMHLPGVKAYIDEVEDVRFDYELMKKKLETFGPLNPFTNRQDGFGAFLYFKYVLEGESLDYDNFISGYKFYFEDQDPYGMFKKRPSDQALENRYGGAFPGGMLATGNVLPPYAKGGRDAVRGVGLSWNPNQAVRNAWRNLEHGTENSMHGPFVGTDTLMDEGAMDALDFELADREDEDEDFQDHFGGGGDNGGDGGDNGGGGGGSGGGGGGGDGGKKPTISSPSGSKATTAGNQMNQIINSNPNATENQVITVYASARVEQDVRGLMARLAMNPKMSFEEFKRLGQGHYEAQGKEFRSEEAQALYDRFMALLAEASEEYEKARPKTFLERWLPSWSKGKKPDKPTPPSTTLPPPMSLDAIAVLEDKELDAKYEEAAANVKQLANAKTRAQTEKLKYWREEFKKLEAEIIQRVENAEVSSAGDTSSGNDPGYRKAAGGKANAMPMSHWTGDQGSSATGVNSEQAPHLPSINGDDLTIISESYDPNKSYTGESKKAAATYKKVGNTLRDAFMAWRDDPTGVTKGDILNRIDDLHKAARETNLHGNPSPGLVPDQFFDEFGFLKTRQAIDYMLDRTLEMAGDQRTTRKFTLFSFNGDEQSTGISLTAPTASGANNDDTERDLSESEDPFDVSGDGGVNGPAVNGPAAQAAASLVAKAKQDAKEIMKKYMELRAEASEAGDGGRVNQLTDKIVEITMQNADNQAAFDELQKEAEEAAQKKAQETEELNKEFERRLASLQRPSQRKPPARAAPKPPTPRANEPSTSQTPAAPPLPPATVAQNYLNEKNQSGGQKRVGDKKRLSNLYDSFKDDTGYAAAVFADIAAGHYKLNSVPQTMADIGNDILRKGGSRNSIAARSTSGENMAKMLQASKAFQKRKESMHDNVSDTSSAGAWEEDSGNGRGGSGLRRSQRQAEMRAKANLAS